MGRQPKTAVTALFCSGIALLIALHLLLTGEDSNRAHVSRSTRGDPRLFQRRREAFSSLTPRQLGERGHFFTDQSECNIAKWRLLDPHGQIAPGMSKCSARRPRRVLRSASQLEPLDTIFIGRTREERAWFRDRILPELEVDVVLLTEQGPLYNVYNDFLPIFQPMLDHPHVLHVFTTNPQVHSPKVSGIPHGIGQIMEGSEHVILYRKAFLEHLRDPHLKRGGSVFASYLDKSTNPRQREHVPIGPKLSSERYFNELLRHRLVLSPDGDRPDCKRNWEAIGLGTVPVTQLDEEYYGASVGDNVVYNHTGSWDPADVARAYLVDGGMSAPDVRMVFEEYWIDSMERRLGLVPNWEDDVLPVDLDVEPTEEFLQQD